MVHREKPPGAKGRTKKSPVNIQHLTHSSQTKTKKTTIMNTLAPIVTLIAKSSDWTFILTKLDYFSTLTTSMSPDLAASSSCFSISDPVEGGSSVEQV